MVFRMSSASAGFFHNWHNALPAIYLGPSMLPLPGLLKTWLSSNLYLCQFVWGLSSAVHVLVQCTSTCTADVHCACWIRIRSNLVMLSGSLVACLGAFTSSWRTSGSSWLAATSVHSHCYLSIIPLVGGTVQFSAGIFNHIYMVFIIVLFLIAVLVACNNDSMQA